ncbi:hypothetical protein QR680_007055 [Steinernema hermaphroditum]|uniref:Chromo shadow domain-containing protein n=1 Tax=Steinernema hermaphroditum TaxID=289476 RepID=A0AA39LYG0_9BILA|nr:hypothetical protein QR680_007055 [Steinernema hermaphroditum]
MVDPSEYGVANGQILEEIVGVSGVTGELVAVVKYRSGVIEAVPTEVVRVYYPIELIAFYENHLRVAPPQAPEAPEAPAA